MSGVTVKPQPEITCAACAASAPISPAALFIAKYTPGLITVAAIIAMMATNDSISIAAIADQADLRFVLDHLRRRARRDQRVPAGHRAAGDGDEQEREQAAGPDRSAAVDEAGDRRHLQIGPHDHDAERQQQDRADLEEGGQVVARRQQQPDRQHRGDEAVADDDQRQRAAGQVEPGRELRRLATRSCRRPARPAASTPPMSDISAMRPGRMKRL